MVNYLPNLHIINEIHNTMQNFQLHLKKFLLFSREILIYPDGSINLQWQKGKKKEYYIFLSCVWKFLFKMLLKAFIDTMM